MVQITSQDRKEACIAGADTILKELKIPRSKLPESAQATLRTWFVRFSAACETVAGGDKEQYSALMKDTLRHQFIQSGAQTALLSVSQFASEPSETPGHERRMAAASARLVRSARRMGRLALGLENPDPSRLANSALVADGGDPPEPLVEVAAKSSLHTVDDLYGANFDESYRPAQQMAAIATAHEHGMEIDFKATSSLQGLRSKERLSISTYLAKDQDGGTHLITPLIEMTGTTLSRDLKASRLSAIQPYMAAIHEQALQDQEVSSHITAQAVVDANVIKSIASLALSQRSPTKDDITKTFKDNAENVFRYRPESVGESANIAASKIEVTPHHREVAQKMLHGGHEEALREAVKEDEASGEEIVMRPQSKALLERIQGLSHAATALSAMEGACKNERAEIYQQISGTMQKLEAAEGKEALVSIRNITNTASTQERITVTPQGIDLLMSMGFAKKEFTNAHGKEDHTAMRDALTQALGKDQASEYFTADIQFKMRTSGNSTKNKIQNVLQQCGIRQDPVAMANNKDSPLLAVAKDMRSALQGGRQFAEKEDLKNLSKMSNQELFDDKRSAPKAKQQETM